MKSKLFYLLLAALSLTACRTDSSDDTPIIDPPQQIEAVAGLYILNEGNFGANKASLDYFDFKTGTLSQGLFAKANPDAVKGLGDVGNDILIYGSKMYIVVNNSNKVEVVDAKTIKSLKTININQPRSLTATNGKVYVSSYDGPNDPATNTQFGKVAEVDTLSMAITREATVGHHPEELTAVGSNLYVTNSYITLNPTPVYENTISKVDLNSFKQISLIPVAKNLSRIKHDDQGNLYVVSNGDYNTIPANLYKVDPNTETVTKTYNVPMTNFTIYKNQLYYYGYIFNNTTFDFDKTFGIIDLKTNTQTATHIFDTQYESQIQAPNGIAINPENGNILIADAVNFSSNGFVYSFSQDGKLNWKQQVGIIPGHFAFLIKIK